MHAYFFTYQSVHQFIELSFIVYFEKISPTFFNIFGSTFFINFVINLSFSDQPFINFQIKLLSIFRSTFHQFIELNFIVYFEKISPTFFNIFGSTFFINFLIKLSLIFRSTFHQFSDKLLSIFRSTFHQFSDQPFINYFQINLSSIFR